MNENVGKFFSYLFYIRDKAHLTHLAQPDKSLATHKALEYLYDTLLAQTDSLIETYQGLHDIVEIETMPAKASNTPITMVQECLYYIRSNRGIFTDSPINNIIDEIEATLGKTLYLLRFVQ